MYSAKGCKRSVQLRAKGTRTWCHNLKDFPHPHQLCSLDLDLEDAKEWMGVQETAKRYGTQNDKEEWGLCGIWSSSKTGSRSYVNDCCAWLVKLVTLAYNCVLLAWGFSPSIFSSYMLMRSLKGLWHCWAYRQAGGGALVTCSGSIIPRVEWLEASSLKTDMSESNSQLCKVLLAIGQEFNICLLQVCQLGNR